jgi:thiol-disulfide isomerase/thioredoxin
VEPILELAIMNKNIFLILIAGCLCTYCSSEKPPKETIPNKITIIISEAKVNTKAVLGNGLDTIYVGRPGEEIRYIGDNNYQNPIVVKYGPQRDTIRLELNNDFTDLHFRYRGFDELDYLVRNGDSVFVNYESGYPKMKVLNRKTKEWDFEYESYWKEKYYKNDYPSFTKLMCLPWFVDDFRFQDSLKQKYYKQSKVESDTENQFLDSLQLTKLISEDYYLFYKLRNSYRKELINLIESTSSYSRPPWSLNDTLIHYNFHRSYLLNLAIRLIEKGVKKVKSSNTNIIDYRVVFDRLSEEKVFTVLEKDVLHVFYIELIIKSFSRNDIELYFDKFTNQVSNKQLVTFIKGKYNLDFNQPNNLSLKALSGEQIPFEKILSKNRGRLIYVDFWASWCAPCIKSFPESFKLKEDYRKQGVLFIYISKDEDFSRWAKASEKYRLEREETFIIDNQFTSSLMDDLKIQSIPRYLLFDKNGSLIHSNAPNPEGTEIRNLLNDQLHMSN